MADQPTSNIRPIDKSVLWLIENYTDGQAGNVQVLTPVTANRVRDPKRKARYMSSILINFHGAEMSAQFEIPAESLEEALDKFVEVATGVGIQTVENLKRQAEIPALALPASAPTIN